MALVNSIGGIQKWYEALVEDERVLLSIDKENLLDSEIAVSIVTDDINDIVKVINSIGLLPNIPDLTNPESVEVYFNGEDYENVFYVKVVVDKVEYVVEIDGTTWAEDKIVNITFSIDDVEIARLEIAYLESDEPDLFIVDADKAYTVMLTFGLTMDPVAVPIYYDTYVFEGCITENADGVVNGFRGTFTNSDESFYTVYGEGVGIWTYSGLDGIKDFDFTFDNIPHYGFGYDSDDFKLDVDLDNFEFNWGADNKTIEVVPEDAASYVDKAGTVKEIIDDMMDYLGFDPNVIPE